jgi:hypothetical protein
VVRSRVDSAARASGSKADAIRGTLANSPKPDAHIKNFLVNLGYEEGETFCRELLDKDDLQPTARPQQAHAGILQAA